MSDQFTLTYEENLRPLRQSIQTAENALATAEEHVFDCKTNMRSAAQQIVNGFKALKALKSVENEKYIFYLLTYQRTDNLDFRAENYPHGEFYQNRWHRLYRQIHLAKASWREQRRNLHARQRAAANARINLPRLKQELRMKELTPTRHFEINLEKLRNHLLLNECIHKVEHLQNTDGVLVLNVHISGLVMNNSNPNAPTNYQYPTIPLGDLILRLTYYPNQLFPVACCAASKAPRAFDNNYIAHPHWIQFESPCLGDFYPAINDMTMTGDIAGTVYLYMAFLGQYDAYDSAGQYFGRWIEGDWDDTLYTLEMNTENPTYRCVEKPDGTDSCPKPELILGSFKISSIPPDEDECESEYDDDDDYDNSDNCPDCDYHYDDCICAEEAPGLETAEIADNPVIRQLADQFVAYRTPQMFHTPEVPTEIEIEGVPIPALATPRPSIIDILPHAHHITGRAADFVIIDDPQQWSPRVIEEVLAAVQQEELSQEVEEVINILRGN